MIYGIGNDITEIDRVARLSEKTSFLTRFFSEKENKIFSEKSNRPETIAGNFAAKEAFSKALGTGIRGFELRDVSVLRDSLGKPYIELGTELSKLLSGKRIFVTISHSEKYAVATVVIEEDFVL